MTWLLLLTLLLPACTLRTATDGPVTVILGPQERIAALCRGLGGGADVTGCLVWSGTRLTLACGYFQEERCIAHEVRHLVEPGWRH